MNDRFVSPVTLAKRICVFNGDTSFSHLARVLAAVGQAATEVYENAIPSVRSEFVQIQANLTAPLPMGAANVLKVGVLNDHGQIIHLYEDKRLRRVQKNYLEQRAENCDGDATDIENSIITKPVPKEYLIGDWFHGCDHHAGNYGELYGYRFDPASIGTWRANESEGVIEFGSGPLIHEGRWLIVEFKDMGEGRFSSIPSEASAAIMTRARWWLSGGGNAGVGHMRDFQRELAQYRRSILRMDVLDYLRGIGSDSRSPYLSSSDMLSSSTTSSSSSATTTTTTTTTASKKLKYYVDDTAAMADGLSIDDEYLLAKDNNYSLPGGLHKTIYGGP